MDPTACLERLLDAFSEQDRDESLAAMDDLKTWLDKGGFLPGVKKTGWKRYEVPVIWTR